MSSRVVGRMHDVHIAKAVEEGWLVIQPYDPISQQPGSVDVTLDNTFLIKKPWVFEVSSAEDQRKNCIEITIPRNTLESLKGDPLWENKGVITNIRRFLFSAKRFFLAGVDKHGYYVRLLPFSYVLGALNEFIMLDNYTEAVLDGKSAGGRMALSAHVTAGYAEMGYKGKMTTESVNPLLCTIRVYSDSYIGQLRFSRFETECQKPYNQTQIGNNYQGHTKVHASKGLKIKKN